MAPTVSPAVAALVAQSSEWHTGRSKRTGETFFVIPSRSEPGVAHWGGANDGVVHYPLTWDAVFLLDNTSRKAGAGTLYLAAPVLIY